jgi:hypothetical protein
MKFFGDKDTGIELLKADRHARLRTRLAGPERKTSWV